MHCQAENQCSELVQVWPVRATVLKGEEDVPSRNDGRDPRVEGFHLVMVLSGYGTQTWLKSAGVHKGPILFRVCDAISTNSLGMSGSVFEPSSGKISRHQLKIDHALL